MRSRRVLWLSHFVPYPPRGGALIRSYGLLRGISRFHSVDLLSLLNPTLLSGYFGGDIECGIEEARANLGKMLEHVEFVPHVPFRGRTHRLVQTGAWWMTGRCYSGEWAKNGEFARRLGDLLGRKKYDLIHFDTISLSGYRRLAPNAVKVMNHHNIESEMVLRRANQSKDPFAAALLRVEGRRIAAIEAEEMPHYATHLVCSDLDKDRLERVRAHHQITVVPNAVDVPPATPRGTRNSDRLLFIGGMGWYPNEDAVHHLLSDIWPRLLAVRPGLELDIVGRDPSKRIRNLARQFPRVRLLGYVPNIAELYGTSAAFLCPIRDGGGTKLKVLDAAAHGMPIVAYAAACEGIAFEDGRQCRIATTQERFVTAVLDILSDSCNAERLGQAARACVMEKYETSSVAEQLALLYSEIDGLAEGG